MEDYPWLKNYDDGVPYTLNPYPDRTMIDVVDESAMERPYRAFMYFHGAGLKYHDFIVQSDAFAYGLVAESVAEGDRVALLLPNCPQFILALQAIWKAGAIAVPVNPYYTEHELEIVLNEVEATTAIVMTPFYQNLKEVQPRTSIKKVIVTNIKEYLPFHKRLFMASSMGCEYAQKIDLQPGDLWFQQILRKNKNCKRPDLSIDPDSPAMIFVSGGINGVAMGAVCTHQSMVVTAMQIKAWLKPVLYEWDDRFMLSLPLYHVFGCLVSLGTALLNHSSCIMVHDPRNIDDVAWSIGKYRPACLPGITTFLSNLIKHPSVISGKVPLKSIKISISGDMPVKTEVKKGFEKLTGGRLIEGFAMTETMQAVSLNTVAGINKEGSAGIPLPDVIIKIVDAETGMTALPAGKLGEICIKSPCLMQAYWNRPEETAAVLKDGWFYSGEIGYMDKDGTLFLHSRKNEVIKTSGFYVWPREVEEVLQEHPGVIDAGVAGVPDPYKGESVKAWVVLSPDANNSPDELRDYCRNKLAAYKVPQLIEIMDSLPKSQVGKILKRVLIDEDYNDEVNGSDDL